MLFHRFSLVFIAQAALFLIVNSGHAQTSGSTEIALREEVRKPLFAAQDAIKANDFDKAITLTREALAVPKLTPVEQKMALQNQSFAAIRAKNWDVAYEASGKYLEQDLNPVEKLQAQEWFIIAAQSKKDYARIIPVAKSYSQNGGKNASIHLLMLQSMSLIGDHAGVAAEITAQLKADDAAQVKTPEAQLRVLNVAYRHLKNDTGYLDSLKRLALQYPSKAYLNEYVARLMRQSSFNPRYELEMMRIAEKIDGLEDAADYLRYAELALKAGLPSEAVGVLNKAYAEGILGKEGNIASQAKMKTEADAKAKQDDVLFSSLQAAAKDSNDHAAIADVMFSKRQWNLANEAYAKALNASGLRREHETRLHYAISLIESDKKSEALAQLKLIQGEVSAVQTAEIWTVLLQTPNLK